MRRKWNKYTMILKKIQLRKKDGVRDLQRGCGKGTVVLLFFWKGEGECLVLFVYFYIDYSVAERIIDMCTLDNYLDKR